MHGESGDINLECYIMIFSLSYILRKKNKKDGNHFQQFN